MTAASIGALQLEPGDIGAYQAAAVSGSTGSGTAALATISASGSATTTAPSSGTASLSVLVATGTATTTATASGAAALSTLVATGSESPPVTSVDTPAISQPLKVEQIGIVAKPAKIVQLLIKQMKQAMLESKSPSVLPVAKGVAKMVKEAQPKRPSVSDAVKRRVMGQTPKGRRGR